jgi:hypothetical protein
MVANNELWIRTDEAEDVAASVRHALRCFELACDDEQVWKWAILALHSAIQGACVCHLLTTAHPVGAVTKRNAGEWLTYFEDRRKDPGVLQPKTQLIALPDLLKSVRKPHLAADQRSGGFWVGLSAPRSSLACRSRK